MNTSQDSKKKPSLLWWGLLGSLSLHAIIFILRLVSVPTLPQVDNSTPIEISEVPPPAPPEQANEKAKQPPKTKPPEEQEMAETEDAKNKEIDPNAKYLSDRNQKVEKQTRAKSIDDFRKQQGTGLKSNETKAAQNMPRTGDNSPPEDMESEIQDHEPQKPHKDSNQGIKRDWKTLSLKDLGIGGDGAPTAATDDRLNGVDEGNRTILSTREFKYFSYYHRIKELLRQYWKPSVERKLYSLYAKGKNVGEDEMTTRLLVLLDPNGQIQKISRVTSSGIAELDEAAIEAFHKAGPFPNPPSGILDPDGFVRIRWDFILKTEAAPRIQFSSAGRPTPP